MKAVCAWCQAEATGTARRAEPLGDHAVTHGCAGATRFNYCQRRTTQSFLVIVAPKAPISSLALASS